MDDNFKNHPAEEKASLILEPLPPDFSSQLNLIIIDAYRSILKVEEKMLRSASQIDLTISEMHMLESVGKGKDRRSTISEIAEDLDITPPSVTVAINKLMKKGYVEKIRGEQDGRIVYVALTRKGRKIDSIHRYFHENMVRNVISGMSEEEQRALYKGVQKLDAFLKKRISLDDEQTSQTRRK